MVKPPASNTNQLTITLTDGRSFTRTRNQVTAFTTEAAIKTLINSALGVTDIWFHKNRNGRWAIATGATPPAVWPEDEVI